MCELRAVKPQMLVLCLSPPPPQGVDFYSKALRVDDRVISLQLWDTAGQERFQSVTKAYYRGAQGVILMYDISQEESFIAVKSWISSIQVAVRVPVGHSVDAVNKTPVSLPACSGECGADAPRHAAGREQTGSRGPE